MQIRRPLAALLTALALASGGALTACESPGRTGTPADNAKNTSGGNPTSVSQGSLPLNSNKQTGSNSGSDRAGGNHKGTP
jgi:hypothetical protein